jgi:hypothetical protein
MATQDELIQAELDWTIEELEAKQDDDLEETETQTVEQPTEEVKAEEEVKPEPKADTTTEKQSSVVKLLKQRNEARAEVEQLKTQIKDNAALEARVKELEESIASSELAKEEQKERDAFYQKYPTAVGHEEAIEKLKAEKDLSYSEAFQLYAAQTDPTLLMDEQYRNKSNSWATLTWVARVDTKVKTPSKIEDFSEMSDDDFLAWSDAQAKNERLASWYIK